jgi:hypothetical protein
MANAKGRYDVPMTVPQMTLLVKLANAELVRLNAAKYQIGNEGVTHYDERIVEVRMQERILRNVRDTIAKVQEGAK